MTYNCPDCGRTLTYSEEDCVYKCACGYFEDWEVIEGKRDPYFIGADLQTVLRSQMFLDDCHEELAN